jgi:TRAP transporter TAXI family solute receptor
MSKNSSKKLLGVLLAAFCAIVAGPAAAEKPTQITMLTGSPGGSWYPISAGIAKVLGDNGIKTRLEQGGGNSNVLNVAAGKAEVAFGLTTGNYLASIGKGVFKKPVKNVMALQVLYTQLAHTVVTVESGVKTYDQLKGRRMASQSMASGSRQIFEDTLKAYGLINGENDLNIVFRGGGGAGAKPVRNRQAVGFITTTAPPTSSISETAVALPIRLLPISEAAYAKMKAANPGYGRGVIRGGIYKGVDQDVPTVSDDTVLVTNKNVSDDTAYWVVRTIAENLGDIRPIHPALKSLTAEKMSQVQALKIHPGAMRYYREIGVVK